MASESPARNSADIAEHGIDFGHDIGPRLETADRRREIWRGTNRGDGAKTRPRRMADESCSCENVRLLML